MESGLEAALVVETAVTSCVLVEVFDHPIYVREGDQICEGAVVRADAEVDPHPSRMRLQRSFGE